MSTQTTDTATVNISTPYSEIMSGQDVYYPSELEKEMGETAFHYNLVSLLYRLLESYFAHRGDALVAADLMVYFEEGDAKRWLAPDIFVCFGVENHFRRTFKTWEEGVFPQVVFEIASDGTYENDLGSKRLDYARLGVEEYYLLDPERMYLPSALMAFSRQNGKLLSVDIENNRVLSPLMKLEIVDTGRSFRLFDPVKNEYLQAVLSSEE